MTEEGASPCYVAVDEARQLVYGANYHKGELNTYKILPDGSLEAAAALFHKEPTGPHKNQDHAHTHYTDTLHLINASLYVILAPIASTPMMFQKLVRSKK